jgi:hypothetical protein
MGNGSISFETAAVNVKMKKQQTNANNNNKSIITDEFHLRYVEKYSIEEQ